MPIPDYQSLMLPVLKLAEGGEIHVRDAADRLAQQLALTPDERVTMLPSGRQTLLSNRMHWAKTYMQKAGLVRSTRRAHFAITDRGRDVLASKPARIDNEPLMHFDEFRDFLRKSRDGSLEDSPPQDPKSREIFQIFLRDFPTLKGIGSYAGLKVITACVVDARWKV